MRQFARVFMAALCVTLIIQIPVIKGFSYAGEIATEDGWTEWFDMSEMGSISAPSGEWEQRTVYRTRDREYMISNDKNLRGWEVCAELEYWSDWGDWTMSSSEPKYILEDGDEGWVIGYCSDGSVTACIWQKKKLVVNGQYQWFSREKSQGKVEKRGYMLYRWNPWSDWNSDGYYDMSISDDSFEVETKQQYRIKLFGNSINTLSAELIKHDTVKLSWNLVQGATGYQIYYREIGARDWNDYYFTIPQNQTDINIYIEDGAGNYEFRIVPYRDYGGREYLSREDIVSSRVHIFDETLEPVTKLIAQDTVNVRWEENDDATGYNLYYKKESENSWKCKKVGTNDYNLKISKVTGRYEFFIQPWYEDNLGKVVCPDHSPVVTFTFMEKSNLNIMKNNKISVKLIWNKGRGEKDGYEIYRATGFNGKYKKIKTISVNAERKAIIIQKAKGKKYYYKIRPYKKVNGKKVYGPYSDVKSIRL